MRRFHLSFGSIYFWAFTLILYLPIFLLILFSFNDSETLRFPLEGFTMRWYEALVESGELLEAARNSLLVGVISSLISTVLGTMAAIAIVRYRFIGRSSFIAISALPLVIPSVVIGVALLILFRQLFDIQLSLFTITLSHVMINIPLVILIVAARLAGFPENLEEAAMDLGASYWGAQLRVVIPIIMPALVAAFLTAFTTSFDEYAMTVFITGSDATLPIYIYSQLRFPRRIPIVAAVGAVILVASILIIFFAERYRRSGMTPRTPLPEEGAAPGEVRSLNASESRG
ncbi:MAG TPA: ABC transporter permease [Anaerolineales bacterium]|nr:ABC transporter permease [Anaerolineales bacterium]